MKKALLFMVTCLLFIGCLEDKKNTTGNTVEKGEIAETITLRSNIQEESALKEIFLTYQDEYDNNIDIYNNNRIGNLTVNLTTTNPLYLKDSSPAQMEYILFKGDQIKISQLKDSRYLLFETQDKVRNNELNFFLALRDSSKNFRSKKMIEKAVFVPDLKLEDKFLKENFFPKIREEKLIKQSTKLAADYFTLLYEDRKSFLENYKSTQLLSDKFYRLAEEYFFYNYCEKIITLGLLDIKYNKTINPIFSAKIKDFKKSFNNDKSLYLPAYRSAAYLLAQYFILSNKNTFTGQETFLEFVNSNFNGQTKEYLLFKVTNNYLKKDPLSGSKLADKYYTIAHNKAYKNNIAETIASFTKVSGIETELEDYQGNKVQLDKFLSSNKGSVLYIDIWASWCMPCIKEMPFSDKLKQKLKAQKIKFFYFSFDEKKADWKNSNAVSQNNENFLVKGNFKSKLAKEYKITSIPRYLLFDQGGKLITSNAKRPSDPELEKILKEYIQ